MKINGNCIEMAMANSCMTISELSKISNVSRTALAKFISGKSNPKPATVGKIAKALNVDVCELIDDTAATVNQSTRDSEIWNQRV